MNKKITKVVFNSDVDDWSHDTSVFDTKISNKSNLCFLIEDTNNNKFGGVFTGFVKVTNKFVVNDNTFIFSLTRNGKFEQKKYQVRPKGGAFHLYSKNDQNKKLFAFGYGQINDYDICVFKKGVNDNHCHQHKFAAKEGDLIDGKTFTPKRIVVYQLVDN
ncbi:hypothetical protein EIN_102810 [Entamoeba invadens IP1]|uniref:TLDc domain-containing protein n=1 Tax=Entamoeba invadens IP1 TaxID=370355 RepID=A0A0A1U3M5_ENTIV|nr:hypothetical protein EIN_102810 [Entamoeba invadens IP1]ELP88808.1 hypothetical protein EIN_102810 [Entamoeba invadens IP1]|eukprot:XP_004255579.1 hypothetical protein EIN_102810 [Entamoeba invadens IP1]